VFFAHDEGNFMQRADGHFLLQLVTIAGFHHFFSARACAGLVMRVVVMTWKPLVGKAHFLRDVLI
jgi:hypothetical protein